MSEEPERSSTAIVLFGGLAALVIGAWLYPSVSVPLIGLLLMLGAAWVLTQ